MTDQEQREAERAARELNEEAQRRRKIRKRLRELENHEKDLERLRAQDNEVDPERIEEAEAKLEKEREEERVRLEEEEPETIEEWRDRIPGFEGEQAEHFKTRVSEGGVDVLLKEDKKDSAPSSPGGPSRQESDGPAVAGAAAGGAAAAGGDLASLPEEEVARKKKEAREQARRKEQAAEEARQKLQKKRSEHIRKSDALAESRDRLREIEEEAPSSENDRLREARREVEERERGLKEARGETREAKKKARKAEKEAQGARGLLRKLEEKAEKQAENLEEKLEKEGEEGPKFASGAGLGAGARGGWEEDAVADAARQKKGKGAENGRGAEEPKLPSEMAGAAPGGDGSFAQSRGNGVETEFGAGSGGGGGAGENREGLPLSDEEKEEASKFAAFVDDIAEYEQCSVDLEARQKDLEEMESRGVHGQDAEEAKRDTKESAEKARERVEELEEKHGGLRGMLARADEQWQMMRPMQREAAYKECEAGGKDVIRRAEQTRRAQELGEEVEGGRDTKVGAVEPTKRKAIMSYRHQYSLAKQAGEFAVALGDVVESPQRMVKQFIELLAKMARVAKERRDNAKRLENIDIAKRNRMSRRRISDPSDQVKIERLREVQGYMWQHEQSKTIREKMEQVKSDRRQLRRLIDEEKENPSLELEHLELKQEIGEKATHEGIDRDEAARELYKEKREDIERLSRSMRKIEHPDMLKLKIARVEQTMDNRYGRGTFDKMMDRSSEFKGRSAFGEEGTEFPGFDAFSGEGPSGVERSGSEYGKVLSEGGREVASNTKGIQAIGTSSVYGVATAAAEAAKQKLSREVFRKGDEGPATTATDELQRAAQEAPEKVAGKSFAR